MEDQRTEEIWWENEIRSGRDPRKGCGCPLENAEPFPRFGQPYTQVPPQKEFADEIVDIAVQHFGIESAEEKCNLKILFDAYTQIKMRESFTKAFSNLAKKDERK